MLDLDSGKNPGTVDIVDIGTLEIRLENVSFVYPGRLPILQNVDADFLPWEIALLREDPGSGSILPLLRRFYLPGEGRIFSANMKATTSVSLHCERKLPWFRNRLT